MVETFHRRRSTGSMKNIWGELDKWQYSDL